MAWVLILGISTNYAVAINNIASEKACIELAENLGYSKSKSAWFPSHQYRCVSYEMAK